MLQLLGQRTNNHIRTVPPTGVLNPPALLIPRMIRLYQYNDAAFGNLYELTNPAPYLEPVSNEQGPNGASHYLSTARPKCLVNCPPAQRQTFLEWMDRFIYATSAVNIFMAWLVIQ